MTEAYTQLLGAVRHRFLILELHRERRKKIWLRLDRRAGTSTLGLLRAGGSVPAHDVAQLSASKLELVGLSRAENRQVFTAIPSLGELQHFLKVIGEELTTYQIWPANCWFFCSLLQQHLEGNNDGRFEDGELPYPNLARDIRQRIAEKLRRYYNMPAPFSITELLLACQNGAKLANTPAALALSRKWDASPDFASPERQKLASKVATSLRDAAEQYMESRSFDEAKALYKQSTKLSRELSMRDATQYEPGLAMSLLWYEMCLQRMDEFDKAVSVGEELASLSRRLYTLDQDRYRSLLGLALFSHGSCLHHLGLFKEARVVDEEAVVTWRQLYKQDKERNRQGLANALHNYGASLRRNERHNEACVVDAETLELRRTLYERSALEHRAPLADSLYNYGVSLFATRRIEEACEVEAEAVTLRRNLYDQDPNAYRADLAAALHNFGISLRELQRVADACEVHAQAVALHWQLYDTDMGRYRDDLTEALRDYAVALRILDRTREADAAEADARSLSI